MLLLKTYDTCVDIKVPSRCSRNLGLTPGTWFAAGPTLNDGVDHAAVCEDDLGEAVDIALFQDELYGEDCGSNVKLLVVKLE